MIRVLLLWAVASLALTGNARAAEFFVSPKGNDGWAGMFGKPFATFERARDAIRQLEQQQGGLKQRVTVCLPKGTHFLQRPLTIGPGESDAMVGTRSTASLNSTETIGTRWNTSLPRLGTRWNASLPGSARPHLSPSAALPLIQFL